MPHYLLNKVWFTKKPAHLSMAGLPIDAKIDLFNFLFVLGYYSCTSGSATKIRPQYSQTMIFLP